MIVVAYQRTQAGAMRRMAERGRIVAVELLAPKAQPEPVVPPEPPHRPSAAGVVITMPTRHQQHRRIIDLVARMHKVSFDQVLSLTKRRKISNARMAAICAVKEWENQAGRELSLPQIGRIFGRDHTTVLHAMQKRGYREKAHG